MYAQSLLHQWYVISEYYDVIIVFDHIWRTIVTSWRTKMVPNLASYNGKDICNTMTDC